MTLGRMCVADHGSSSDRGARALYFTSFPSSPDLCIQSLMTPWRFLRVFCEEGSVSHFKEFS
jgi:hypothetical protein